MENPFSVAVTAATVEVIVDTKEQVSYQTTKMQREIILTKLKEKGCRITKQRLRLILSSSMNAPAVRKSSTGHWKRMTSWELQPYTAWSIS